MRKTRYTIRPASTADIDSTITRIRTRLLGHRAAGDEVLAGLCEQHIDRLLEKRTGVKAQADGA